MEKELLYDVHYLESERTQWINLTTFVNLRNHGQDSPLIDKQITQKQFVI